MGKASAKDAKKGAQKAGQRLDELLPYHPKHQLAIDGPVPYNVYDRVQLKKQIIMMAKKSMIAVQVKKTTNVIVEISHPVINGNRTGGALKTDYLHAFNDIIDNHERYAKTFTIEGGDKIKRELYQITGSNNGKNGVFEWIVEPNGDISHRRFIENGVVTTLGVRYEKKPSTIVEISQVLLDVLKGTSSAVYHLGKDFVLGTIQMLEDIRGTLEALGNMIVHPIETGKYIEKTIYDSLSRI